MRYLSKLNLARWRDKICLLRVDLDIEPGQEENNSRIDMVLPTIKLLLKNNTKVILLGHRGRPDHPSHTWSLAPFVPILSRKLNQKAIFLTNLVTAAQARKSSKNQLFLLENLRFWPDETENNPKFAKKLAFLGDFYINEAFGTSHRKNASISAITRFLPSYAGLHFEQEIKHLSEVLKGFLHPFVVILGGAKIAEKLGVVKNFWRKADYFLLGSNIEKNKKYTLSSKIIFPIDTIAGKDVGPKTIKIYSEIIKKSKTIIWNGPMGKFERRRFSKGTTAIWNAILKNKNAKAVVGGGETIASLKIKNKKSQIKNNVFLSTGGGAMLDYLSGKNLPGIAALKKYGK